MIIRTLETDPEFTLDAISREAAEDRGSAGPAPGTKRSTRPVIVATLVLVVVVGAAASYLLWKRNASPAPNAASTEPAATVPAQAPAEPAIAHPVEKIPTADTGQAQAPLPALDDSDNVARDVIAAIAGDDALVGLLVPNSIIRHIVATIDNLPRASLAARMSPLRPAPGSFATAGAAHGIAIAEDNARRYAAYVKAAEAVDTQRLVGFYVRLYPLFQQAYVELGYPRGYFNDRLIGVIDHLLAAPEPRSPVYLIQPKVRFEFADPELEALSAGQKILVRVGLDNELRLKAKLRDVRGALTAQAKRP